MESLFNSEYCEIKYLRVPTLKKICERLLLKMCSWNCEKIKIAHKEFSTFYIKETSKNVCFLFHERKKSKSLFLFHDWFPLGLVFRYSTSVMWWEINSNNKYLFELIKRRSKIQENNMSCENYKPMRVWLWLVYKFTENHCRFRLFSEFIQTQKRYPTSLDKIRILTWKLLFI